MREEIQGAAEKFLAWLTIRSLEWVISEEKVMQFALRWHKRLKVCFRIHGICVERGETEGYNEQAYLRNGRQE